jgi:serine protease Do
VGINSSIWTRSGGYQGISFAIPINQARRIAEDLAYDGKVSRGWLGVTIEDVDPELADALGIEGRNGAKVVQVAPQTPAAKAGMLAGDVVLAVDGHVVTGSADLRNHVADLRPGQKASLRIQRDGKEITLPVVVGRLDGNGAKPEEDASGEDTAVSREADGNYSVPSFGLRLSALDDQARELAQVDKQVQGVVVSALPESPAAEKGIPNGAVVLAWKGPAGSGFQPVKDPYAFAVALEKLPAGSPVALKIRKGDQIRLVGLKAAAHERR